MPASARGRALVRQNKQSRCRITRHPAELRRDGVYGHWIKYGVNDTAKKSKLFVTTDFTQTIKETAQPRDELQRPVTFVLWLHQSGNAFIISPFEVEKLLPIVRDAAQPWTHMITYTAPTTRSMLAFNNLDLFVVPSLPRD